jgi:hypothetical protein
MSGQTIDSSALLAKLHIYEDALKEIARKRLYDGWIDRADRYQSGYADARRRDVKTAKDALANICICVKTDSRGEA